MDENPTTTTTTTHVTHSTEDVPYRSTMASRNLVISQMNYVGSRPHSTGGIGTERSPGGIPASVYSLVTLAGVTDIRSSADREKKDMQVLTEQHLFVMTTTALYSYVYM